MKKDTPSPTPDHDEHQERVGGVLAEDDGRLRTTGRVIEVGEGPVLDLLGHDRRAVEERQDDDVELQEEDHQDLGEDGGHVPRSGRGGRSGRRRPAGPGRAPAGPGPASCPSSGRARRRSRRPGRRTFSRSCHFPTRYSKTACRLSSGDEISSTSIPPSRTAPVSRPKKSSRLCVSTTSVRPSGAEGHLLDGPVADEPRGQGPRVARPDRDHGAGGPR